MNQWIPGMLRRLTVVDAEGRFVGIVESTYPLDGCAPEFAIVRTRRFGQRILVPLERAVQAMRLLHVPYTRAELEDAPALDNIRYFDDAVSRSRGYWSLAEPAEPGAVAPLDVA